MSVEVAGQVITFYSYKGGTGRSMALANVAWILASNGKRVLVIDWDFEKLVYSKRPTIPIGTTNGFLVRQTNPATGAAGVFVWVLAFTEE